VNCTEAKEHLAARLVDGDAELRRHLSECVACRGEAESLERTLRAMRPLAGPLPAGDDLFVAAVRRGYAEAQIKTKTARARHRWRLPAATVGVAAVAALVVLIGPRLGVVKPQPAHLEHAIEGSAADESASELIGDLDDDELERLQARFGKGT
jgi:hypothetical protein